LTGDSRFGAPFIDVDEWRDQPARHRYVHGGFEDTHTRFSFYFPPAEKYRGRFFQYLEGGAGGHDNLLAPPGADATYLRGSGLMWIFDVCFDELGGYLVESNQGHFPEEGLGFADEIELYGASAQVARYSKVLAAEIYGTAPHHGYIWGQSGGGVRSLAALENVADVWDGGVPEVATGGPSVQLWSANALAVELVRRHGRLHDVVDALEPGGSGDPFATLDSRASDALATAFRMGLTPSLSGQLGRYIMWVFTLYMTRDANPGYYEDFWTRPGYLGHDEPDLFRDLLINDKTTITKVVRPDDLAELGLNPMALMMSAGASGVINPNFGATVAHPDTERMFQAHLRVLSGKAAGREMVIYNVVNGVLTPFPQRCPEMFDDVEPGDEVAIDNRDYLAFLYYHRHHIAGAFPPLAGPNGVVQEHRHLAYRGVPIYPQQPREVIEKSARPFEAQGDLKAKTILVMCKQDICYPHGPAVTYHRAIQQQLGDRIDDTFRIWWVDNATHADPTLPSVISETERNPRVWRSRLVDYGPLTAQALRDVVAWAEDDIAPPSSTNYQLDFDNELVLAPTAETRGGIQPVATLTGPEGSLRIEAKVGQTVTLTGTAEAPPGTGRIVRAQLDPEGTGRFGQTLPEANGSSESLTVTLSHTYTEPGTYFPSFRVGSRRYGAEGPGDPVLNLARVRVVVTT